MTWYPAYTRRHEFLGTLHLRDDSELLKHKWAQLTGTEQIKVEDMIVKDGLMGVIPLSRVNVRLEEVARSTPTGDPMRPYERETLFHYVTIEDQADRQSPWPMDPELNWHGATFVPLGAPLMCEYCPDRLPTKRTNDAS